MSKFYIPLICAIFLGFVWCWNKEKWQGAWYANGLIHWTEQYCPVFDNYKACKDWALSKLVDSNHYSYCMSECHDTAPDGTPICKKAVRSRAPIPGFSEVFEWIDANFYNGGHEDYTATNFDFNDNTSLYGECIEPENPYDEYDEEWHYTGFERAERTGGSCDWNSASFNEGCEEYYEQEEAYNNCLDK